MAIFIFFALGILFARFITVPSLAIMFIAALLFVISLFLFERQSASNYILLLLLVLLGILHSQNRRTVYSDDISKYARYLYGQDVSLEGEIISDVSKNIFRSSTKTTFILKVTRINDSGVWKNTSGTILVNIFRDIQLNYADRILILGKLHQPFSYGVENNFSYKEYLRNKGINYILSVKKNNNVALSAQKKGRPLNDKLYFFRNILKERFNQYLSFNESAIMRAFILGDRSNMPNPIEDIFIQTGTMHILAISGLHVSMIASVIIFFLKIFPFKRIWQYIIAIILLIFYCYITESRPSVVRSTVMIAIFLFGFILEKESDLLNNLALAGFVLLLYSPFNLFDVGFQLSFICVLAIIVLVPFLNEVINTFLKKEGFLKRFVSGSLAMSLGVWIFVCGLIYYYFQIITPVTILANIFVIPVSYALLILGLGLLVFSFINPWLTMLIGLLIKINLNFMVGIIFLMSKLPMAYIVFKESKILYVVIYYMVLCSFLIVFSRYIRARMRVKDAQQTI